MRSAHATTLLRQCDHVFRPHNCWLLHYRMSIFIVATHFSYIFEFFLSRKLYYVVALSRCRVSRAQLCHYICLYKYFLVRPYTLHNIFVITKTKQMLWQMSRQKNVPPPLPLPPPGPIISWPLSSCAVWFGNILLKNGADIVFGLTFCGRRGWSINFFSHSTPHPWSRVGVGLDSCL